MIYRCENPNSKDWEKYGGRGISVCEEWHGRIGFYRFVAHMGKRPDLTYTLDRINNDGNYEPSNVRWSTKSEQVINRRKLKTNTSGYTGVWQNKGRNPNKWRATIGLNGKKINLGVFDSKDEAAEAYRAARKLYFN